MVFACATGTWWRTSKSDDRREHAREAGGARRARAASTMRHRRARLRLTDAACDRVLDGRVHERRSARSRGPRRRTRARSRGDRAARGSGRARARRPAPAGASDQATMPARDVTPGRRARARRAPASRRRRRACGAPRRRSRRPAPHRAPLHPHRSARPSRIRRSACCARRRIRSMPVLWRAHPVLGAVTRGEPTKFPRRHDRSVANGDAGSHWTRATPAHSRLTASTDRSRHPSTQEASTESRTRQRANVASEAATRPTRHERVAAASAGSSDARERRGGAAVRLARPAARPGTADGRCGGTGDSLASRRARAASRRGSRGRWAARAPRRWGRPRAAPRRTRAPPLRSGASARRAAGRVRSIGLVACRAERFTVRSSAPFQRFEQRRELRPPRAHVDVRAHDVGQLRGGDGAPLALRLERARDGVEQRLGQIGPERPERRDARVSHRAQQLVLVLLVPAERHAPGRQPPREERRGVDVGALVDRLAARLLGRHAAERALHDADARAAATRRAPWRSRSRRSSRRRSSRAARSTATRRGERWASRMPASSRKPCA